MSTKKWQLVTEDKFTKLPVPTRFLEFAFAYHNAAVALCQSIVASPDLGTWPNGSVVLMLAAHSVELFLKGAILSRAPDAIDNIGNHHLDKLWREYKKHFPEQEFDWDMPFRTDYSHHGPISHAEIQELQRKRPIPSMLYRYPVDKVAANWEGIYGFEPHSFSVTLQKLLVDYERIRRLLASVS